MNRLYRRESNSSGRMSLEVWFKVLLLGSLFFFLSFATHFHSGVPTAGEPVTLAKQTTRNLLKEKKTLRIAFVGNSLLYYNDCPGLLAAMVEAAGKFTIDYDACLRGGASFSNIYHLGCTANHQTSKGQLTASKLLNQQWDYIVLQDQSKAPAQPMSREANLRSLNRTFVEPIYKSGATPVFLQTAGYMNPIKIEDMTKQLNEGYTAYANLFTKELAKKAGSIVRKAQVSPVGEAYAEVFQTNKKLWKRLYIEDGLHPTALGTWLQACVLYASILGSEPPHYEASFWKKKATGVRRTSLKLPTEAEAKELRAAALQAVGMTNHIADVD